MAISTKMLRRQHQRKKRRESCRHSHEDRLLDLAYRGHTEQQRQIDAQLQIQLQWLNNQQ